MGRYDFYINMVMRFPGWTPEQIDAMDPEFIEELMARLEAEGIEERRASKPRTSSGKGTR